MEPDRLEEQSDAAPENIELKLSEIRENENESLQAAATPSEFTPITK